MPRPESPVTRRVSIVLKKWPLDFSLGARPTIVIEGRGQPTQWGEGTWQLPADHGTTVSVFLFQRGMTFGRADHVLAPTDEPVLEYRAPAVFLCSGSIGPPGATVHRGRWAPLALIGLVAIGIVVIVAVIAFA